MRGKKQKNDLKSQMTMFHKKFTEVPLDRKICHQTTYRKQQDSVIIYKAYTPSMPFFSLSLFGDTRTLIKLEINN